MYSDSTSASLEGAALAHQPQSCGAPHSSLDVDDSGILSASGSSLPVSTPVSTCRFTATENPFLFPCSLLDGWADEIVPNLPAKSCDSLHQFVDDASPSESDSNEDSPRWWLVHTKPRQEKKLAQQLSSIDIPHYLPATKCKAITRGRPRYARLPLFPSYMFLCVDPGQRRIALRTNRIVATHFIEDQLGLGSQLWNLADLIEKGVPLRVEDRLSPGQLVRIKSGLLSDKTGTIIKRGSSTRLFVFVSELLGGVSLDIEQHLVEPY